MDEVPGEPSFSEGAVETAIRLLRARQPLLLTDDEHEAMRLTAELGKVLGLVVGQGAPAKDDLNELIGYIHHIQRAVLSQAAGRAYPKRYRLLGWELGAQP